ncbi:MAG TPA: iron-containing alcohol dehydrogenase [Spirochaetia bacterium]|nr:iron-containing alcohol dehydrogenase [Spirochaetia bacterium]
MSSFTLETPAAIHFGSGSLQRLREVATHHGRRVLLASGARWLASSDWTARIKELLSGFDLHVVACPEGEPSTETVASCLESARGFSPSLIVAVGGGSVVDTAKALSALLLHGGPVSKFLEGMPGSIPVPGPGVPWVAVPTTAGTGAEVTKNAVILASELGVKRSMRSAYLLASTVIVDPELTRTLPARVTGISGLDALTQLVEAYVTPKTNPFVQSLIEGAFGPMIFALERLSAEPQNPDLRSAASYGALVSGMALANAGLGAAHGFAAALGGMFGVPHGLACAVSLPHVLDANAESIRTSLTRLTGSIHGEGNTASDVVQWLANKVTKILRAFGLPVDLREYHIPAERITEIAEKSSGSSMNGNPRQLSIAEREKILAKIMWGGTESPQS